MLVNTFLCVSFKAGTTQHLGNNKQHKYHTLPHLRYMAFVVFGGLPLGAVSLLAAEQVLHVATFSTDIHVHYIVISHVFPTTAHHV